MIDEAFIAGARKIKACQEADLSLRTYRRWTKKSALLAGDKRPQATRTEPKNKLTQAERELILKTCNNAQYSDLPPSQIVPTLLDNGVFIASVSSFYRTLQQAGQLTHRGRSKERKKSSKPTTYTAKKANEVWSWDITYCHSTVRGQYYYLYMIENYLVYSL